MTMKTMYLLFILAMANTVSFLLFPEPPPKMHWELSPPIVNASGERIDRCGDS
jgi:hypothetical protein